MDMAVRAPNSGMLAAHLHDQNARELRALRTCRPNASLTGWLHLRFGDFLSKRLNQPPRCGLVVSTGGCYRLVHPLYLDAGQRLFVKPIEAHCEATGVVANKTMQWKADTHLTDSVDPEAELLLCCARTRLEEVTAALLAPQRGTPWGCPARDYETTAARFQEQYSAQSAAHR
jgi:hypothetical protein